MSPPVSNISMVEWQGHRHVRQWWLEQWLEWKLYWDCCHRDSPVRLGKVLQSACLRSSGSVRMQIAHRLESVMGCDQVAVMDRGRVVECGPPERLLGDASSRFSALHAKA